jgi:hypothetical protein
LWKCLFILRVIFDIAGHPYEVITVASFYHAEPKIGFLMLLLGISPYIPSYWACWQYAFKREKLFGSQQHVPRPPKNSSYAAKN